jgi:hypothetical protein
MPWLCLYIAACFSPFSFPQKLQPSHRH